MISPNRNTFKQAARVPRNPPPVFQIKKEERDFVEREQKAIDEGHGPVRVYMQGGKKCNTTETR